MTTSLVRPLSVHDVDNWHDTADVLVIGYGVAGACATLEALGLNADVLVVERASGGGGASALSAGIFYLGGGTPIQEFAGIKDTAEDMHKFLMASTCSPDAATVRRFSDDAVEHFAWLESQGIPFERSYFEGKAVIPPETFGLCSTGNEKLWPYSEVAKPAPRGHMVSKAGGGAGSLAMEVLMQRCEEQGARLQYDSRATHLIEDDAGRVIGVRVKCAGENLDLCARRALILCAGGFSFNPEMVRQYVPALPQAAEPLGIPNNDGDGILLGQSAGAATRAMNGVISTGSFYPPGELIKGVLVNSRGERFIAEDSYHGRTGDFVMEQPEARAYLIIDSEIFDNPEVKDSYLPLIDGWDTVTEMAAALKFPEGALENTLAEYNRDAAAGVDGSFHKASSWLKPLEKPPFTAVDLSYENRPYMFLTLGGLRATVEAEVLKPDGEVIPGLYAAGACVSSIPQNGKGYASGLSLGPGSYYGRVAGRNAASEAQS